MPTDAAPALDAPQKRRDNPLTRSRSGLVGLIFLVLMIVACVGTLPWTLGSGTDGVARYNEGSPRAGRLPPFWWPADEQDAKRFNANVDPPIIERLGEQHDLSPLEVIAQTEGPIAKELRSHWPRYWLGTDVLGRSLLVRVLTGGGISLGVGISAAFISVCIGTLYGALAGYMGGRVDALMMRIVDVLYGLPYILLVVLLAVASDAVISEYVSRAGERERWVEARAQELMIEEGLPANPERREIVRYLADHQDTMDELQGEALVAVPPREVSEGTRLLLDVVVLLVAIGGVSWLTMARVIRGQVLSLKERPFIEAARATGVPPIRLFFKHLLPNLLGPVIVYATLTVPQAILQESFLSFLGIGVKPPLPSWGNLVADGLSELNTFRSHWWLLFFPSLLLGLTLLALNFVGEGLREAFDPKRAR